MACELRIGFTSASTSPTRKTVASVMRTVNHYQRHNVFAERSNTMSFSGETSHGPYRKKKPMSLPEEKGMTDPSSVTLFVCPCLRQTVLQLVLAGTMLRHVFSLRHDVTGVTIRAKFVVLQTRFVTHSDTTICHSETKICHSDTTICHSDIICDERSSSFLSVCMCERERESK